MTVKEELEILRDMKLKMTTSRGYVYHCFEDFILREGYQFTKQITPDWLERGEMKMCFKNSFDLVASYGTSRNLIYCEGFARTEFFAMHHAWCVDFDGNVIDPTWKDGTDYFGVLMDYPYILKTVANSGYYGIIDNWHKRWPLMKEQWRSKYDVSETGIHYRRRGA